MVLEMLKELDWSPLWISLKTGIVATVISFFLGIFAARKVVKAPAGVKAVLDGILTLPMVLPPTVAGFFLLLLFSRRRPLGIFLYETFDIKVVQSWLGCLIAATVIAFPLMYRNARAAFELIDVNLIYAGRTLGMSEMKIFLENRTSDCRTGDCFRDDTDICKSAWRIWRNIHVSRKYSGENGDNLPEDCDGHPGRRLSDRRNLGNHCDGNCFVRDCADECNRRKENETCETVVDDEN